MNKEYKIYMYMNNGKIDIEQIAEEYSGYLWKIIVNAGINESDNISEIISDAYLILWKNQDKLSIQSTLTPYLVGITKNLIKKYFYKNHKKYEIKSIENDEIEFIGNDDFTVNLENMEITKQILKILNNMKNEDKEIFLDFYYEERTIKEIAIKNNFSESKVKTKLHRLRKQIKKELLKGGYNIYE